MAGRSAGGDAINTLKSCSVEQASANLKDTCERSVFQDGRSVRAWFTRNLKIDDSKVITELSIKEDGCTTMRGVLVDKSKNGLDKTVYLLGDTRIEMKEALVILLDLCIDCLGCQHLAFGIRRSQAPEILNDLKWVGFELINPDLILKDKTLIQEYVFVGMDL